MSFKIGDTVKSIKTDVIGTVDGFVYNSSMLHIKWGRKRSFTWITQEFPKDLAKMKSKSPKFKVGDTVCHKSAPDRVATVRDESFHDGVVLLDWPHGSIGSADEENLMLYTGDKDIDDPNIAFKLMKHNTRSTF